ncbi:MAG: L,D-transpeptidase family protein [Methylocystis sp.]|nr:L,D-transpeptidase family protein [Methylocystis sp.]MCA3582532.1 L,D-transpeptidase family protein [Methylocystis sp.]MCA3589423.1 L,D-transpeptidase family protein [Methylocystis sp.]MCA3591091.1 L,D-transpeptidase family protein [Methylocystis sp.]
MSQRNVAAFSVAIALLAGWPEHLAAQQAPTGMTLPQRPSAALAAVAAQTDSFRPQELTDTEPAFGPDSLARTQGGLRFYENIVAHGGWRKLPEIARGLRQGMDGPLVLALKERLAISGDLDNANAANDQFDAATAAALRQFQSRHGLSETGAVGKLTFAALNVPAEVRLKQLRASVERLQNNVFRFDKRYVVVNIPGAIVEAVANGKVERRHLAVVGRKERPSPVISARISSVNLNPHWTVPNSIIKNDIAKALKTDLAYLNKHQLRTLDHQGQEIDPNSVNWNFKSAPGFILRQDPGPQNSLGQLKIDMPNVEAVYMHDTPKKELFKQDVRFHSSGCARISDVRDLAAWLLAEQGIDRAQVDRDIEAGLRTEIRLKKQVPVAWVYLTAYGDGQGRVQFREDIYGLDTPEGVSLTTLDGKKRVRPQPPASTPASTPLAQAGPRRAPIDQLAAQRAPLDPEITGSISSRPTRSNPMPRPAPGAASPDNPLPPKPLPMVQR